MALPGAQGSLRILRRHLQLSLHGAIPPPRCQIVVQGAAATKSEGETNLGMVRSAPGGLPPAKADCPPTLVRWTSMTAGYPSEEPIAGKPHDGICGGESQQWLSYPTLRLAAGREHTSERPAGGQTCCRCQPFAPSERRSA